MGKKCWPRHRQVCLLILPPLIFRDVEHTLESIDLGEIPSKEQRITVPYPYLSTRHFHICVFEIVWACYQIKHKYKHSIDIQDDYLENTRTGIMGPAHIPHEQENICTAESTQICRSQTSMQAEHYHHFSRIHEKLLYRAYRIRLSLYLVSNIFLDSYQIYLTYLL